MGQAEDRIKQFDEDLVQNHIEYLEEQENQVERTESEVNVDLRVRRKARLRLFVWTGFSPDYTSGLAFAIAKDETEARKLIEKKHGYSPSTWGDLEILPLTKKTAFSVSGGG